MRLHIPLLRFRLFRCAIAGIPTVHRAAAQSDAKPMYRAPVADHVHARGHMPSEHATHAAYSYTAPASVHAGGKPADLGSERVMFQAAYN